MTLKPAILFGLAIAAWAQTGPPLLGLLFREDWNHKEPFEEVDQSCVGNPNLIQSLCGPVGKSVKKRHHGTDADPYSIWSGAAAANWVLMLHRDSFAAQGGRSKIRWHTMERAFGGCTSCSGCRAACGS